MRQLFFLGRGKLQWREVKAPRMEGPKEAIVRPFAVAKCDLDHTMLTNNIDLKLRIGRLLGTVDPDVERHYAGLFDAPFPFGHECAAEVVEVGEGVIDMHVGDLVAVPFQISCGGCLSCRTGHTACCSNVPSVATYGFGRYKHYGGAMCDLLKVPFADAMLVKLPAGADPVHMASMGDNVADAYRHVGPALAERPGQSVLVASGRARSIAVYTVLIARAMGAGEVVFVDDREAQRDLATRAGASLVSSSYEQIRDRYDIVVDCCASKNDLWEAIRRVKHFGTVTSTGWHFKKTLLPLMEMHATGVTFKIGMSNARASAAAVVRLVQDGRIALETATTRLDSWDNAIEAFLADSNKTIVHRPRLFSPDKRTAPGF